MVVMVLTGAVVVLTLLAVFFAPTIWRLLRIAKTKIDKDVERLDK